MRLFINKTNSILGIANLCKLNLMKFLIRLYNAPAFSFIHSFMYPYVDTCGKSVHFAHRSDAFVNQKLKLYQLLTKVINVCAGERNIWNRLKYFAVHSPNFFYFEPFERSQYFIAWFLMHCTKKILHTSTIFRTFESKNILARVFSTKEIQFIFQDE